MSEPTTAAKEQDIAEQLGERFRPYLNLDKIDRAIHPTCGICKPMKGSDGHTMLAQEFIGNLIVPILRDTKSALASSILATIAGFNREIRKADLEVVLRQLFEQEGISHD